MKRKLYFIIPIFVIVVFIGYCLSSYFSQKFYLLGNSYFGGGKYEPKTAEKYFQRSLRFNPWTPGVHYQLARIYLVQDNLEKARKEINLELKNHPENKRSYYVSGLINGYLKDYSEAEDDFKKFIAWAPDEWAGYMDLSWIYINDHKFQEALDITSRGLEKFPDQIWLLSNKGLALYKLGRYDEARITLEHAQKLAKNLTEDEWKKAYPGNDPAGAEEGVREIKGAISYNLALIYKKSGAMENYFQEVDRYKAIFPSGPMANKIYDTL